MTGMLARLHHLCLTALIALALVLSGQAIAQAKGASPATGHMVLCTGEGSVVVFTDAEGQPTAPSHICPDCTLASLTGTLAHPAQPGEFCPATRRIDWPADAQLGIAPPLTFVNARGPPFSV